MARSIIRAQTVPVGSRAVTTSQSADVEFYVEDDRRQYHLYVDSLSEITREYRRNKSRRFIVFANNESFANYQWDGFFPPRFESVVKDDLNGAFGIYRHEGTATSLEETSYDTWSTFKVKHTMKNDNELSINYHWSQISVLVRQFQGRQFVLFVNCPSSASAEIMKSLSHGAPGFADIKNPYVWHLSLAERLRVVYDESVWKMRDIIRNREKERDKTWGKSGAFATGDGDDRSYYAPHFPYLKEIARHLTHINEAFEVAVDTLESIMYHHTRFIDERQRRAIDTAGVDGPAEEEWRQSHFRIHERLYIATKDIKAIKARASTFTDRLYHENDFYNHQIYMIISETTRRDNATMKALTLVGVLYLPGTFISGIFGSNFFNYTPGSSTGVDWNMTSKFWIYWAVTIPLTLLTLFGWANLDYVVRTCGKIAGWTRRFIISHRPHFPTISFPLRPKASGYEVRASKV